MSVNFESQLHKLSHFKGKGHQPLVHDVFNKESLNLVFASAGGMKSLLMFDLALALANGTQFLQHDCVKSNVLYIDAEMSDSDIGERIEFFKACDPTTPENLSYMTNGDISFNFMESEQQKAFIKFLDNQDKKFDVIVFDNLRTMALFNNENDSSQFQVINQFLSNFAIKALLFFLFTILTSKGKSTQALQIL